MNSLSKREKILLTILFALIFIFLYYNYIAEPLFEKYKTADAKLQNSKKILGNLKESQRNIDEIREQAGKLVSQSEKAAVSIPDGAKVPGIIIFLNDITASTGCRAQKLTFGQPISNNTGAQNEGKVKDNNGTAREESLMIQPVMYTVTGDLEDIMSLLDKIEKSDRKILVDKISINKDENNNHSANLYMVCFYIMN